VLSGHVSTEDVSKRAAELAGAYSKKVVNVLTFGPVGAQEVLLQVKFAEVDRSAFTQLALISSPRALRIRWDSHHRTVRRIRNSKISSQGATTETINNVLNLFLSGLIFTSEP